MKWGEINGERGLRKCRIEVNYLWEIKYVSATIGRFDTLVRF